MKKNEPYQKVLICNIFGLGDVLFTTPIIKNLKAANPHIEIGYLCNARVEGLLKGYSLIDQVFVYERDDFKALYAHSRWSCYKKAKALFDQIKQQKYDVLFDLSLGSFVGFFAMLAGIKKRVGFNYKNRSRFLNHKINLAGYEGKHIVEYYLDLLAENNIQNSISDLEFPLNDADVEWAHNFFVEKQLKRSSVIGLVPGGGASWGKDAKYKHWGVENFAKLADKLIEKFSAQIILIGDATEDSMCKSVAQLMKHPAQVSTDQSIYQFAALLKMCKVVVLNDGGPLHISVAAGASTVSIFGPVDERVYGPFPSSGHRVITSSVACRPCYRQFRRAACNHIKCLNNIDVEDVIRKVKELL